MMTKIIIAAITLDGKISRDRTHTVDWTSKKDKNFFRSVTKNAGVVIFGSSTYKAMGRPMPERLNIVMTRSLQDYKIEQKQGLLEFTDEAPNIIIDKLEKRGYSKVVIGGGSIIYSMFLQQNLVDEIYLTIAPKIFGKGVPLLKEIEIPEIELKLYEVGRLGKGEVVLKYRILNSKCKIQNYNSKFKIAHIQSP